MKTEALPYDFLAAGEAPVRGGVTAAVIEALRQAIVGLTLKPGETIDKGAVCARLGVSRFPVSEALARLQAEGLVDIQPQRGSVVSLVRLADVGEYMLLRRALECEALRVVAPRRDCALIASLRDNLAAQRTAVAEQRRDAFHRLDLAFHALIFDALSLPRVRAAVETARANLDRARRLVSHPRRLALTVGEHEAILAGLEAADPEAAATAMRAHLDAVMGQIAAYARDNPALFADSRES